MRTIFLTCECGQRMKVPRSAAGKMGMCPACGKKIPIGRDVNSKSGSPLADTPWKTETARKWQKNSAPDEAAKRDFGQAADLYCEGRFGEALAIFDMLARRFPESPEIQSARAQCIVARNRKPMALPEPTPEQVLGGEFNEETERLVKRVLLDKMLNASSEAVQVQAAEVIGKMMGMFPGASPPAQDQAPGKADEAERVAETARSAARDSPPVELHWSAGPALHGGRRAPEVDLD